MYIILCVRDTSSSKCLMKTINQNSSFNSIILKDGTISLSGKSIYSRENKKWKPENDLIKNTVRKLMTITENTD